MAKRQTMRRKSKKSKRYSRKMMGGALDEQALMQKGFTSEQITALLNYGIESMDLINISLQQTNPQTGAPFTPQELIDSLNDAMNEVANLDNEDNVVEGVNPPAEMNMPEPININQNNNFQPGPALAMEDLQPESPRSVVDFPQGGRRQRMSIKKAIKKRGRSRNRKMYISRNRKTYKVGACYGNGVGANPYDPNNSIFNTRELQLFPYKPY